MRREAAIKTDHQQLPWPGTGFRFNAGQFIERQAERLFAKHMLARAKRRQHLGPMRVVTRCNDDGIDRTVTEQRGHIRCRSFKAEFTARVNAADACL